MTLLWNGWRKNINQELRSTSSSAKRFCGVLVDRVRFFKESKEGRGEGHKEGLKESVTAVALRMLETRKYTMEEVVQISGASIDEVKKL